MIFHYNYTWNRFLFKKPGISTTGVGYGVDGIVSGGNIIGFGLWLSNFTTMSLPVPEPCADKYLSLLIELPATQFSFNVPLFI